ncbi:MAG: hypothetical protein RIT04_576 [Candidatus Parcubacteria bacterium]|jgi:uncharacterized protein YggE
METIKQNTWKAGMLVGGILALFLLVLTIAQVKGIFTSDWDKPVMNTITVSGTGDAVSIPDIATFSFTVTETQKTVVEAQDKSATKLNATLAAIKAAGVLENDIKTQSYSINPHYEYTGGVCTQSYPSTCTPSKNVLTGYDVSQTILVKIRDLSKAGEIFGLIGGQDVKDVNGLAFSIDDVDSVKQKAQGIAIIDAKTKAAKLAKDLGVHLGRIVSFNADNGGGYPYYAMDSMSMKATAVAAPRAIAEIPAGEQKVTSNVSITYEIR